MSPSTIYNEINICTSIIDTANKVIAGLGHLHRCTGASFNWKIRYFEYLINKNYCRIRHLQSELDQIALNWVPSR